MALYRQYIKDVWQLPDLEGLGEDGGASGLVTRYFLDVGPKSRKYLDLFHRFDIGGTIQANVGATERPQVGDAVVFGPSDTNKYGHVGIVTGFSSALLYVFDQNGIAAMSGRGAVAKITAWSMGRVTGWLRKKV